MRHQKSGTEVRPQVGAPPRAVLEPGHLADRARAHRDDRRQGQGAAPVAERTITWATSVGNLVGKDEEADAADKARIVHAMRMAQRVVKHKPTLQKLFAEVGPRFVGRAGWLHAHHEARLPPRRRGADVDHRARRSRRAGGRGDGGAGAGEEKPARRRRPRRRRKAESGSGAGQEEGAREKKSRRREAPRSRQEEGEEEGRIVALRRVIPEPRREAAGLFFAESRRRRGAWESGRGRAASVS